MIYIHSITFLVIYRYIGYYTSGGISFYYTLFSKSKTSCFTVNNAGLSDKKVYVYDSKTSCFTLRGISPFARSELSLTLSPTPKASIWLC